MRKCLLFLLILLMVFPLTALADQLGFTVYPQQIRPGKLERIMARSITNKTDDTPEKAEAAHDNSAEV